MDLIVDTYHSYILPLLAQNQPLLLKHNKRISVSVAVALAGFYFAYNKIARAPRNIRHIPQIDLFGFWGALFRNETLDSIAKKYTLPAASKTGLYTRFDFNGWIVRVNNPALAKKVLLKSDVFPKTNLVDTLKGTIIGRFLCQTPNIIFSDGAKWKAQRMVANPAFKRSLPVDLFGRMSQKVFMEMDRCLDQPIDFYDMMRRWTLDCMGLASFGFDFNAIGDQNNEWAARYNNIVIGMFDPLPLVFPALDNVLPSRKRLHNDLTLFLEMMKGIIAAKREELKNPKSSKVADNEKDLLTLMIESEMDGNGVLTNDDLLSNLCVFFIAGLDTTTHALCYIAYYLAVNPEIQQKARQEAVKVLGDTPKSVLPTVDDIREMPYIHMIIKEATRICPPLVTVVARHASQDTDLNGTFIPKGTRITIDTYEMHNNPKVWSQPDKFIPERFAPGGEADLLSKEGFSWLTFGNGEHQCIGMQFSLTEQRVLLSMMLRKYEWSLPEDSVHKNGLQARGLIISSPGSLTLNLTKRF